MAVSSLKKGLLPMTQTAMRFDKVAYHDYEGVVLDMEERERLLNNLGDCDVMLLRNHGALAVGRTVAEGFNNIYRLERACRAQLLAQSGERRDHPAFAGGHREDQPHVPARQCAARWACWNGRRCGASPTASILPTRTEI